MGDTTKPPSKTEGGSGHYLSEETMSAVQVNPAVLASMCRRVLVRVKDAREAKAAAMLSKMNKAPLARFLCWLRLSTPLTNLPESVEWRANTLGYRVSIIADELLVAIGFAAPGTTIAVDVEDFDLLADWDKE